MTWFFDFFKKFQKLNEPCTERRIRAKFRAYPSGDSLGIVAAEKKKKTRGEMRCISILTGRRMVYISGETTRQIL